MPNEENQDIENLSAQDTLAREIENTKSDLKRSKKLLVSITEFSEKFDALRSKLDNPEDGVEVNLDWIQRNKNEIVALAETARTEAATIVTNLEKVSNNILQMEQAFNEFSEIKGKITSTDGEIQTLVDTARSLHADIQKTKEDTQKILDQAETIFSDIQAKVQTIQASYEEFLKIQAKIDDENTGLKAIFSEVQSFNKRSSSLIKEIEVFKTDSGKIVAEIKSNKEISENLKRKIEENLKASEDSKEEIKKITALVTDTGFSTAFQRRARTLFLGYIFWAFIFGISLAALLIFLYFLFIHNQKLDIQSIPELQVLIYRISLTSPLLFLIGFSVSQYSKERELNERYEFKNVTATVIREHIEFLREVTTTKGVVDNFAIGIFQSIYAEPYESKGSVKKKDIGEKEANLKSTIDSIKELKALLPNEEIFNKVTALLADLLGKK